MTLNSMGDAARAFSLRHQNTQLKLEIDSLNAQIASGQASDLAEHLGGSYSRLTAIERDMRVMSSYAVSISEGQQFSGMMQSRLEQIDDLAGNFANTLVAADASSSSSTQSAIIADARQQFNSVVSALNSQTAGRSIFSGDATDQAALKTGNVILAEIEAVVAGATSMADIDAALDTWFNDPAGFDAFAYTGSASPLAPFRVSETAEVPLDIKANEPALRDVLKSLAKVAVVNSIGVTLMNPEVSDVFRSAGEDLLTAERDLVALQARVGITEEQLENWSVRTQIENAGLEFAKGALLSVDPYDTATRLEAAQFQLESLYAVTVRLSQLSLVNFLR